MTSTTATTTTTHRLSLPETPGVDVVDVTVSERGQGHPFLLLHGGGGPGTVEPWADVLAGSRHARVITPTHPGFAATRRPDGLDSVAALARLHVALLEELDLTDVTVVGSSIGGWVAAELATLDPARVSSVVLLDAVGLAVPGHPVADFFSLTPQQLAERSYADPAPHVLDPAALPDEARAVLAGNRAAIEVYAGHDMVDPTLRERLGDVRLPLLAVWGEADRIVDPEVGRAYADAVPGGVLEVVADAGHLPHLEQPDRLVELVWDFADRHATPPR